MGKCNFRVSVNLVLEDKDSILLMRRYNTGWNDGMYALMGGHVEDSENPIDALIREAKEELGIELFKEDIDYLFTMAVNPDHIYLYFGCNKYLGNIENKEFDQCDDIRFFNVNKLPENIIGADKKALSYILSENSVKYDEYGYRE